MFAGHLAPCRGDLSADLRLLSALALSHALARRSCTRATIHFALLRRPFALVREPFPLVGGELPFIRQTLALVRQALPFVRQALALVREGVAAAGGRPTVIAALLRRLLRLPGSPGKFLGWISVRVHPDRTSFDCTPA